MDKMPCSISDGPQLPEDVEVDHPTESFDDHRERELDIDTITVEVVQISDDTLKELGVEDCFKAEFMRKEQAE